MGKVAKKREGRGGEREKTIAGKPQDFADLPLDIFTLEQEIVRSDKPAQLYQASSMSFRDFVSEINKLWFPSSSLPSPLLRFFLSRPNSLVVKQRKTHKQFSVPCWQKSIHVNTDYHNFRFHSAPKLFKTSNRNVWPK